MDGLKVWTRAVGIDQYAGKKGHDYIEARGLKPRPNHNITACAHCAQQEKLPAVQNICASDFARPKATNLRSLRSYA